MRTALLLIALAVPGLAWESKEALQVPKGATEVSPGVYRHVDASRKAWRYQRTPFGVSRMEEKQDSAKDGEMRQTPFGPSKVTSQDGQNRGPFALSPSSLPADEKKELDKDPSITKAVEQGDSVRFERASPVGTFAWTRKKSELTKAEQEAWNRLRTAKPAGKK